MLDVWRLRSVNQTWQWAQPYQWWTIQLEHSARIENVSVSWADISRRYPIRMINLGWSRWLSLVLRLASWLAVDLASVPHSSQCKWACRQPCVPAMICHRHRMTHHRNFGRARLILNRRFGLRCRRDPDIRAPLNGRDGHNAVWLSYLTKRKFRSPLLGPDELLDHSDNSDSTGPDSACTWWRNPDWHPGFVDASTWRNQAKSASVRVRVGGACGGFFALFQLHTVLVILV